MLDSDALTRFARAGRRRKLKPGETVEWQGDEDRICATLAKGVLKLSVVGEDGDTHVVGIAYPPDFVGSPFDGPAEIEVTALTECEVCIFPRRAFLQALGENRRLETELLKRTIGDLERARLDRSRLGSLGACERLSALLVDLAGRGTAGPPSPGAWFELPLSRGEIAALLDLRIETVSREFGALEAAGVVERKGRRGLRIRDRAELERRASNN